MIEEHQKTLGSLKNENEKISLRKAEAQAEFDKTNGVYEDENENIENIKTIIIDKSSLVNDFRGRIVNYNILIDNFVTIFIKQ